MIKLNAKPIHFKFGEYLSNAFEFLKINYGNLLLAFIFCFIMSIIPFCSVLAIGNFYKYCKKLRKGQLCGPGEIFDFDDFGPYAILQLIIIAGVFVIFIPVSFLLLLIQMITGSPEIALVVLYPLFILFFCIALFVIGIKAFYIPALISLGRVKDIRTAWNMSKKMSKDSFWAILFFSVVIGALSQIGIVACGIGLLLTMPFSYVANYFAYEDAMQQVEYDEIKEIGVKDEY